MDMRIGNGSATIQPPCLECQDRKVGCHGKCAKYNQYRSALDASIEEAVERKIAEEVVGRFVRDCVRDTKKKYQFHRKKKER